MSNLQNQTKRLLALPLSELVQTAGRLLNLPMTPPVRSRIFTPSATFWLFLGQILSRPGTCSEALRQAQPWVLLQKGRSISSNTSAYCQARARLPLGHLQHAFNHGVRHLAQWEREQGLGRRVCVVDGSSCSMPDTKENQEKYPQPGRQKFGCGFPVMRFVGLFSLATGALLGVAQGSLHDHERTLWRRLWDLLAPGDIALADRGFCSFADYALLVKRGVDAVMRPHSRRTKMRVLKRLGKGDRIVLWPKSSTVRPAWVTKEQWDQLPDFLTVRYVTVAVAIPGFRVKTFVVATTLLDPKRYGPQDLAELYRRRWTIELYLRDIKTTMGMDILRCKVPELIEKEFMMHLIAYNLVRSLMLKAAAWTNKENARISLAGTIAAIRQWSPSFITLKQKQQRQKHLQAFLQSIADDIVPHRPGRVEPRALKRRPKNYQLLNQPRHSFREIIHRNRYKRPLS